MGLCWQERQRAAWMRWAVGVWIGFTVASAIKVLVQPTTHTVYPVFAEAARNWWQDRSLYEPAPDRDLYRYSPTFAVLMTPWAVWPHWLGGLFWLVGNVGLLLAILDRSAGEIFRGIDTPERKAIWLVLTLIGSARSLWAGQSNSLILVLAIAAMLAIGRQRWWLAALVLAGGGFIKVWPWALALLAAACWPRQLIIRLGVCVFLWGAIPFLTKPPETVLWQYSQWLEMLRTTHTHRWGGYRDAWIIWELVQFPVPRELYELVQCETALAVFAWCLWQRQQLRPAPLGLKTSPLPPELASEPVLKAPSDLAGPVLTGPASSPNPGGESRSERGSERFAGISEIVRVESGISGGGAGGFAGESAGWFGRTAMALLGAWAAWQLLFGPGTERLTYILIAPMAAWAVLASWQSGRYRALAIGAWILISLFSMGALERLVLKITGWGRALLPLGVAVFACWLILHETVSGPIWRRSPPNKEHPGPNLQNIPKDC